MPPITGTDPRQRPASTGHLQRLLPGRQALPPFSVIVLADPDSPLLRRVDSALRSVGATDVRFATSAADLIRRMPQPVETGVGVITRSPRAEAVPQLVAALRQRGWRRLVIASESVEEADVRLAISAKVRCLVRRPRALAGGARPASAPGLEDLSPRELQVLQAVADGNTNNEIGRLLGLSSLTVKSHLARIGRKAGTGDRAEMVALAMRSGMVV